MSDEHTIRCSLKLFIHLSEWLKLKKKVITLNVGEDTEKLDDAHIAGGDVIWYSHSKKQFGSFS